MFSTVVGDWFTTISLIFGGCCSNAITLEQLTTQYPLSGSLITAFQFLIISLHGIPKNVAWTKYGPRFRPHHIPLTPYLVQVALFYLISLLNNAAFSYRIPMSVHIIFRSGGLVISMLLGWLISSKRFFSLSTILWRGK
jgi:UDP-xylose/UDP-N-acetylglucosamine transporter B4